MRTLHTSFMTTIIKDSDPEVIHEVHEVHHDSDGGLGTLVSVIVAIILLAILLFYGLPLVRRAMNRSAAPNTINVNLNANVPDTSNGDTNQAAP